MLRTLYICYFAVREPLVQTQVLPYLRELRKGKYADGELQISILTFEPESLPDAESIRSGLADEGIDWHWLPYHKRFSVIATAWDILRGTLFIRRYIARERPDILHGRVHVPTLMGALGRKLSRRKPKLLFDIRGFFPEEYTDAGVWPEGGWLYRAAKRVEKWLLKEADGFVVLTEKAREILFPESAKTGLDQRGRPVEVIPCCVDLEKFRAADDNSRLRVRAELGIEGRRVIAYVGSFGGWYLTDDMLDFFAAAREYDPATFVMILTQRNSGEIAEKLRGKGFGDDDYYVDSVKPDELPQYLVAADLAVSLIKACYSKQSSSPTKIAEYLACGLPIVSNRGVGDVDALIEGHEIGALIDEFSTKSYQEALKRIDQLGTVGEICRDVAAREFDLEKTGGKKYCEVYRSLLGDSR
jgi:glycosyltransferase involved in cell wall biosynthesis